GNESAGPEFVNALVGLLIGVE
ncbi:MAG: hypothetical protein K0S96_2183, partial [Geminicoccaceae bacterium]|nr:hypothetical protein [Geminicoccaceae bacterium]